MTEQEINELEEAHKASGESLGRFYDLAEKHGAKPGESVYEFIAGRLNQLSAIENRYPIIYLNGDGNTDIKFIRRED